MSCWVTSSHIFEWNDVKAGLSCQIQQMIDNLCWTYMSKSVIYSSSSSCYRAAELWFGTRSHVFTCIYCIFCINSMFNHLGWKRRLRSVRPTNSHSNNMVPCTGEKLSYTYMSHMSKLLQNFHSQAVLLMLMSQTNTLSNR